MGLRLSIVFKLWVFRDSGQIVSDLLDHHRGTNYPNLDSDTRATSNNTVCLISWDWTI